MQFIYLLLAALLPVAVLLFYTYRKDSAQPEPPKWLWKAFLFGIVSFFLSLCLSVPTKNVLGLAEKPTDMVEALIYAFGLAAIPEELAKLFMLWLLLRKNPFFDERFDGIVYAVCVGMGFAAFENILLVVQDGLGIAVLRMFTAVPEHFFDALIMGYFYSLFYFTECKNKKTLCLLFVAPIVAHGVYDALLMVAVTMPFGIMLAMTLAFLFFLFKLMQYSRKRIGELVGK